MLLVLLLVSTLFSASFFYQNQTTQKELATFKNNPQDFAKAETKNLIAKVGSLVELPNEEPTVATVTDVSKLKSQPFFSKAQNGDKVLIFTKAKKAYLYSVSLSKILEVAPLNIGASQPGEVAGAETSPSPSPSPAPKE